MTYNIRDSPVVTHPSTSLTITSLSMGERTGSRVLWYLWSYVEDDVDEEDYRARGYVVSWMCCQTVVACNVDILLTAHKRVTDQDLFISEGRNRIVGLSLGKIYWSP
jgi:hypothetical protein